MHRKAANFTRNTSDRQLHTRDKNNAHKGHGNKKTDMRETENTRACQSCPSRINALNGLYCTLAGRYVERATTLPCANRKGGHRP